ATIAATARAAPAGVAEPISNTARDRSQSSPAQPRTPGMPPAARKVVSRFRALTNSRPSTRHDRPAGFANSRPAPTGTADAPAASPGPSPLRSAPVGPLWVDPEKADSVQVSRQSGARPARPPRSACTRTVSALLVVV